VLRGWTARRVIGYVLIFAAFFLVLMVWLLH
jgi:hypothetical protein